LTTKEIEHGVPQGSILGPTLISLHINDPPINIMGSKIVLFEDDTNILVSDENKNNLQYKLNYEGVSKSPRTMLITRKSLVVHEFPARVCCDGVL